MKENREELIKEKLIDNYERYYHLAYSYVRNEHDAMDIVQESAYKAIIKQDKLKSVKYVETWIYRIVINTALDYIRKNRREQVGVEDYLIEYEDQYQDFDIMESLARLEEKDRTVVVLRFFEGKKLDDIAKITRENVNTVKTRLYRSLKKLKIILENGGVEA